MTTTMLYGYNGEERRAIEASAEYLETVGDLSHLNQNPHATPALRDLAKKRLADIRAYTLVALKIAGYSSVPVDLAKLRLKEKREHRRQCEKRRRERLAQRESLKAA